MTMTINNTKNQDFHKWLFFARTNNMMMCR
ncbi:hypothetical protein MSROBK_010500 [Spiroplasma poulsonii]|uniref:Uncharacterized protein n=1 Tax=Spiroplasma poulsonii TaxID=2138 RepID=A0A2P6FCN4_9MOLU|nr:hypothetical protein MSROBK_010500 [Spiroplasma poulsonii]PQM31207.1 hypothetical protein SMSRO_SF010190 [Spiroplasma poulsonii]PWF96208.1 hypothetical protein SMSE_16520 [Spiroplasma poulsonii]PWF98983.1 hypothetical protein SMH99_15520 [Spiroplasma poulsonii]